MFTRRVLLLLLLFVTATGAVVLLSFNPAPPFHTQEELDALRSGGNRSPIDSGEYFLGSVRCQGCHGYDTLRHANVDLDTNDVNLYSDWQSSMMALSAKDPLWRAKVSQEILTNPAHANQLQTKCTACHAPMGHFNAMFKGHPYYTIADLENDTLGLNGVACGGCHQIANDSLGLEYSGNIHYDTTHVEYGPFVNPVIGPMQLYVGLIPTHSFHTERSQFCASCHTLLTETADLSGNLTGNHFVEQATYHEWLNSAYNSDQPCQSCHMPKINDPVILANGYFNLPPRSPFNLHKFMGANVSMLKLIKANKAGLNIDVPDADFDSTITATLDLLKYKTIDFSVKLDSLGTDSAYISVSLVNKAGHKFPSGYPSRRAFVQFAVTSGTDTLFESGMLQPDYEVSGQGSAIEPHYNVISRPDEVQIYEMVMGDVNGNFTTVLERADVHLKDNRIPPLGFSTQYASYDTTKIVGVTADADFNKNAAGTEGTGADVVHYHIPLNGFSGTLKVSSALYYQSIPPRWFSEMFNLNSQPINDFKSMYQAADKTPVLVAADELDSVVVVSSYRELKADEYLLFPVPVIGSQVFIKSVNNNAVSRIEMWDAAGRKVSDQQFDGASIGCYVNMPPSRGVYFLKIYSGGRFTVKKVVRQ